MSFVNAMKPIEDRFRNSQFVAKFFQLLTIEESKGNEKFNAKNFHLFKALFRNYGSSSIIADLFEHMGRLIADRSTQTHECSHKLAAELMAGLIRGSKNWSLDELKFTWAKLKPLFDAVIENVSNETLKLWYGCFSAASEDQDPRRLAFYLNYFSDLIRRVFERKVDREGGSTSFQQSSCLYLAYAFSQLEWRAEQLWSGMQEILRTNLTHPYKAVRERIANCLVLLEIVDVDFSIFTEHMSSAARIEDVRFDLSKFAHLDQLVGYIEAKLIEYIDLFAIVSEEVIDGAAGAASSLASGDKKNYNTPEHLDGINFLQSTFAWLVNYRLKSLQPINPVILRLIPQVETDFREKSKSQGIGLNILKWLFLLK